MQVASTGHSFNGFGSEDIRELGWQPEGKAKSKGRFLFLQEKSNPSIFTTEELRLVNGGDHVWMEKKEGDSWITVPGEMKGVGNRALERKKDSSKLTNQQHLFI